MCSILEHNCAHFCINTPGSYVCRCKQGYILNSDEKTCRSKIALLMCLFCPPRLSCALFFDLGPFNSPVTPSQPSHHFPKEQKQGWLSQVFCVALPPLCLHSTKARARHTVGHQEESGRSLEAPSQK